jgi:serine/threonine protein kinase/tetratricopeptide (TPR) repeat protein
MGPSATRWARLRELFDDLSDLPEVDRRARLDAVRDDDPTLVSELEAMLREHDADDPLALEELAPRPESRSMQPGQRVGPYRLVEVLGRGGMGQVFLAERVDGQFEQQVALKVMRGALHDVDDLSRFMAERQILAKLEHPNIARLLDGGVTEDGSPYIVMELVLGQPITRHCDEAELDVDARLALFIQVCEAVQAAHRRLVVHRDLKPSNILVTDEGTVKLLDFGIAKLLEPDGTDSAPLTRTGLYVLTPEYASPEQVSGEDVGTTADVYALGLLLYELLTGIKGQPVEETSPLGIFRAVCEGRPERPSRRVADGGEGDADRARVRGGLTPARLGRRLRGDLDTIVEMAIRKEADRRYLSVEDLADDIRRHGTSLPVRARRDTAGYHIAKFIGRHRIAVAAAAIAVLALIGGLTMSLTSLVQARAAEARAVAEAEASRELADFLVGLFRATDPEADPGAEVSARSLLDRGAEDVQKRLEERPELRADLLFAIGRAYFQLGLGEEANPLLIEAAQLREEGGDLAGSGDALVYVAFNHVRRGAPLDGIAAARRAVAMLEPIAAEDPYSLARATSLLGQTLYGTRMHQQAVPVLEKSIALNQTLDPVDTKQLAADLDNLGNALMALGETDRGLEQLERSVAVLEEAGADPALMANGLTRLGLCQLDAGRVEEARASLTRSRPFATEAAGNGHHTEVADVESAWATYWTAMGDLDEATACLRRAAAETEAVYGMEHPRTAMISLRLGTALQEAGQPHEALDRLRLGREILAATAAGHLGHLQAFDLPTARVLIDLGRFQEAREVLAPLAESANTRRADAARELLATLDI